MIRLRVTAGREGRPSLSSSLLKEPLRVFVQASIVLPVLVNCRCFAGTYRLTHDILGRSYGM